MAEQRKSVSNLLAYRFKRSSKIYSRGLDNVWIGTKEANGPPYDDPESITFTDGSIHDYIPPNLRLNYMGHSCIRFTHEQRLDDNLCTNSYSFMCMSDALIVGGKHQLDNLYSC